MSEGKFTPAPWSAKCAKHPVDGEFDWGINAEIDGKPRVIAEAFGIVAEGVRPDAQANAHLIAAAPELYEALQGMFDLICVLGYKLGNGERPILKDGVVDQKMMATRAALEKARGDSVQGGG
jgi:hypothetical protein